MDIAKIPLQVHGLMVPQDKMYFPTGFFCLVFQFIDQPKRLGDPLSPVKEIPAEYQMAFSEGPLQVIIDHSGSLQ